MKFLNHLPRNFCEYFLPSIYTKPALQRSCSALCIDTFTGVWRSYNWTTRFFISKAFFSTQSQCYLTFSWIEIRMLLRCCLVHTIIVMLIHILYLAYLYPCLCLGLFMSYLGDLYFIFSIIFISINQIISLKSTNLLLHIFKNNYNYFWMILQMKKAYSFEIAKV